MEYGSFDDIIDTRDLVKRRDELTEEYENLVSVFDEANGAHMAMSPPQYTSEQIDTAMHTLELAQEDLRVWEEENKDEVDKLNIVIEELGESEAEEGIELINSDYFEEYAQTLAEDMGLMTNAGGWPYDHIDWAAAAEALEVDYTSIEFDDGSFFYRS